jgi:RNA polymerase sigma factor (sigma-70 family)
MADTEIILLRRFAASHDAAAFGEITRRHAGLVYGAAWRVLADMDRAADVAQETFLQLTKDAGKINGSLPGWLHRVATDKAIDVRRREASRRHREAQYAEGREYETKDWKDISPYVDEGLRLLDPELRDVLVAHFLDGQTTRRIADSHGVSQATVSRRIEAGVNQLRGILRKRGIIVAVGALGLLLNENAAQGAPAVLMTELGKMALAGGTSAASAATAGGASSLFSTAVSSVVTGVKANAVAIAAVAVIGAGSVITYRHVAGPTQNESGASSVSTPAPVARSQGPTTVVTARSPTPPPAMMGAQPPDQVAASAGPVTVVEDRPTIVSTPSSEQAAAPSEKMTPPPTGPGFGGFAMGGGPGVMAGNNATRPGPNPPSGGYYYYSYAPVPDPKVRQADPNDPNDSNATTP